ncbi:MAG: helix-turn-helix domain-containing protein [Acidimicrobiales bacterium]
MASDRASVTAAPRSEPRARTRLEPSQRHEEILAVAAEMFRDRDYHAVSLEAIAEGAGVTRGLLHHYFGSKRALYLEVVRRAVGIPDTASIVPRDATGDLHDVIAACVDGWLTLIETAGGLWSGSAGTLGAVESDLDLVVQEARDHLVDRMVDELPFPDDLDRPLLRAALRCYAGLARVAGQEWLQSGTLTREQAAALLRTSLIALADTSVPAMDAAR